MTALIWLCFLAFSLRRLRTYLHIFQQEEYDNVRFIKWMAKGLVFDRFATALLLLSAGASLAFKFPAIVSYGLVCIIFLTLAFREQDPRQKGKKRLAMTGRARRIFYGALAFSVVISGGMVLITAHAWIYLLLWIVPTQILPLTLILANVCLIPYERTTQKRFWNEAHAKLKTLKPTVIGITGSYGKTSVKHIFGHILGSQGSVLITPGSVNTPMGIARVVREQLGPHHRFFVCEMGAYGKGSIARLCRLSPPDMAIITAIGHAHYERFKSLEAVVETKFELAEAVIPRGGKVVVAENVLTFPTAQGFARKHSQAMVSVGTGPEATVTILEQHQSTEGLRVELRWDGKEYTLRAKLFGEHHAMNMALAFAAACVLGVQPEDAVLAMESVPQISHRLEVKKQAGGSILIDDAYNSNPAGFANGLRLLSLFKSGDGRRILVTPGMVELGAAHDEQHRKIGLVAAANVDVLLPVLPERISALIETYSQNNPHGEVILCATFAEAERWLQSNLRAQDVVLLENDLPDLYERRVSI